MKARIGVMSEELIRMRILSIAAGTYKPQENEPKVWFTSLHAVSQLLCDENRELLKIMKHERPETISELSELSGRKLSNISKTLKTLSMKGFVKLEKSGRTVKPIAVYTDFEIIAGDKIDTMFQSLKVA